MRDRLAGQKADSLVSAERHAWLEQIYTIFEGTSEILPLVIALAITEIRIR